MANTKITTAVIKDDAITTAKIADDAVTGALIADDVALAGNPTTTTQSAGNSTTRIATTAFVTTAVSNLVDSAPGALDTLNELAAALGDDASFSTTVTNSIATKLPLAGGTLTGDLVITGTTPTLAIGDAGAEDTAIVFDGNAQDFYIGLDDSADHLIIGKGSTVGTTPIISVDGNESGLIGTTASRTMSGVTPNFFLEGTSYADSSIGAVINANGQIDCPAMFFGKSRGTSLGSNTVVQNGDRLFSMRIDGSDGTNLEQAAIIEVYVDGTVANNSIPGHFRFMTTTVGDQYATEKMRIDNAGNVLIGGTTFDTGNFSGSANGLNVFDATHPIVNLVESTGGTSLYMGKTTTQGFIGTADAHDLRFITSDSDSMKIDSAGHVTMPKQPAFSVLPSSSQDNIAVTTAVTVVFGTERFDVGSNFASNTFTAPVTGKYQFNAVIRFDNADSAALFYQLGVITTNESYTSYIDPDFGQDTPYWTLNVAVLADMDASDTAYVTLFQHSGTQQTDIQTDSWFSGYLVA